MKEGGAGEGRWSRSSKVVQEKNGGAGGRGGLHIKVENSEMGEVGDRNPRIQDKTQETGFGKL